MKGAKAINQILAALAVALVLCAIYGAYRWGRTEPEPPLGHGARLEGIRLGEDRHGERLIRLNDGNPAMVLSAYLFESEFVSPQSYAIGQGDRIEFLPLLTSSSNATPEVEIMLEANGERTTIGRARATSAPGLETQVNGEILSHTVALDLSDLAGRTGRIVWRVDQAEAEPAAIAGFKYIKARASHPPSMLLICSDTHRYDYSLAGRGPELMPELTKFASEATVFDKAYSSASWTLPSITSVLTGRYPRYHLTGRRVHSGPTEELEQADLPAGQFAAVWGPVYHQLTTYPQELPTLPQLLRDAGYTTVLVFANSFFSLSGLYADGFDVIVDASVLSAGSLNYAAKTILENLPPDRPVFLYIHYLDVHEFERSYAAELKSKNPESEKEFSAYMASREEVHFAYASSVEDLDSELGELFELWRSHRNDEESLVAFYSDHGEHLLDPGHPDISKLMMPQDTKLHISFLMLQVPLLNHGNSMAETLLHVPLAVRFPKSLGIGPKRVERAVSLVDMMPTFLKIADVEADLSDLDWTSLIPGDDAGSSGDPRVLFADFQLYGDEKSSIRRDNFKLTLNLTEKQERLWNEADWVLVDTSLPAVAGEGAQEIRDEAIHNDLKGVFGSYAEMSAEAMEGISSDHSPDVDETTEQLKRLGYIR